MGGVTPLLVSSLSHWNRFAPAHYVAITTAIGLIAALRSPEEKLQSVTVADETAA